MAAAPDCAPARVATDYGLRTCGCFQNFSFLLFPALPCFWTGSVSEPPVLASDLVTKAVIAVKSVVLLTANVANAVKSVALLTANVANAVKSVAEFITKVMDLVKSVTLLITNVTNGITKPPDRVSPEAEIGG